MTVDAAIWNGAVGGLSSCVINNIPLIMYYNIQNTFVTNLPAAPSMCSKHSSQTTEYVKYCVQTMVLLTYQRNSLHASMIVPFDTSLVT